MKNRKLLFILIIPVLITAGLFIGFSIHTANQEIEFDSQKMSDTYGRIASSINDAAISSEHDVQESLIQKITEANTLMLNFGF